MKETLGIGKVDITMLQNFRSERCIVIISFPEESLIIWAKKIDEVDSTRKSSLWLKLKQR